MYMNIFILFNTTAVGFGVGDTEGTSVGAGVGEVVGCKVHVVFMLIVYPAACVYHMSQ